MTSATHEALLHFSMLIQLLSGRQSTCHNCGEPEHPAFRDCKVPEWVPYKVHAFDPKTLSHVVGLAPDADIAEEVARTYKDMGYQRIQVRSTNAVRRNTKRSSMVLDTRTWMEARVGSAASGSEVNR